MSLLQCLEREVGTQIEASVIWLHGLGATAHDFYDVPPALVLPPGLGVRFVFPQAPTIPVTLNHGMRMPAWYDIRSLGGSRNNDVEGIERSRSQVGELIAREVERGVDPSRIVIGGFSQGGAIALHTALRHGDRLAGVMVLSAYLLLADQLDAEASAVNRDVPVFMAHGTYDPVVRFDWATTSRDRLQALGWDVEWHEYPMPHSVCPEEITAIGVWLSRVLAGP